MREKRGTMRALKDLKDFQKAAVCQLLLSELAPLDRLVQLTAVLLMEEDSDRERRRVYKYLREVPLSALGGLSSFLSGDGGLLYEFPELGAGLGRPMDRLADCTIRQFSYADSVYYLYRQCAAGDKAQRERLSHQLTAILYPQEQWGFDPLRLPRIADQTDGVGEALHSWVLYAYGCTRSRIEGLYPRIFPKGEPGGEDKPVLSRGKYIPFSQVITAVATHPQQPLGNWHQVSGTRLYDFFEVLEVLIREQKH